MPRYKIWDKKEDVFTPGVDKDTGKSHWTAQEYIEKRAPWAASPNVKVIVCDAVINGGVFMEFTATVEHYKNIGANITDGMTDAEILAAIEAFEDTPPETFASAEERIAAALEFQNLLSL